MSEKIIKNQEETKEETKTGSEEIVKNEGKEVPEKVDGNPSFWSKVKYFLRYSIQTWIVRCFLIAFGLVFMEKGATQIASQYGLNENASSIMLGIILFFLLGAEFFINYKIERNKK